MNEQLEAILGIILLKTFSIEEKAEKYHFDNKPPRFKNGRYYQGYIDAIHDIRNQIKEIVKEQKCNCDIFEEQSE